MNEEKKNHLSIIVDDLGYKVIRISDYVWADFKDGLGCEAISDKYKVPLEDIEDFIESKTRG